jgi:fatty acid desaturase
MPPAPLSAALEDLAALRAEFQSRGWYEKATGRVLLELAVAIAFSLAGLAVFVFHDNLLVRLCGLLVSTAGSMAVGTNAHTASHYGASDRRWVNEALTLFGFTFYSGLSSTFWWHRHVARHHRAPNVMGFDDDVEFAPWFALTVDDVARATGWRRRYYRTVQWLVFPLALAGNGFSFMATGWAYVIRKLRNQEERRPVHWLDLAALLGHVALWIGLPMLFFPPLAVLGVHALRLVLEGYAMFAVLGPGHLPREAVCVRPGEEAPDFLLQQTLTTVNFRTGIIGRFLCAGLEYQIEHHLFPGLTHIRYPKMSPYVRELCRKHGLPYHSFRWEVALWKCWGVFRRAKALGLPPIAAARIAGPAELSDVGVGPEPSIISV